MEIQPTQTPKRRRLNKNVTDTERTPRQGDSVSVTGSEIPSLTSRSNSVASGQISPTRLADELRQQPKGVLVKTMDVNDEDMPLSLQNFIPDIENIATGLHIVPAYLEPEISRLALTRRSLKRFYPHVYAPTTSQPDTQTPATDISILVDILRIVDKATECLNCGMDEAGWNNHVHSPLLETALYGRGPWGKQLAGFYSCTTASIIPWYRIDNMPGKKIDFTLFIDPKFDPDATELVEALFESRGGSINHTDFQPLEKRPVTVSIETKRHDESQKNANIQMGVWQAAQWRALEQLAGSAAMETLEFLPGLLVFGHQWNFVATSYKDGKTILWKERSIGSSQTEFGVFQIMTGMAKLRAWSVDIFWPWYKLHVLKIGAESEQGDEAEAEVEAEMQELAVEEHVDG
ncbi:hypothetical protein BKA56DRAFT_500093 [Ilyonectria sp. MPI-CAGE-AT-0026]|nr:hypothetical protein BKA56DRAFT_500093 [Ilyonectria sp. MPI-CAGE-AT-0026]